MRFSTTRFTALAVPGVPKFGAELPALTSLLGTVAPEHRHRSVLITHVLDTAVAYVEAVNSVFPVTRVVAIPYSASLSAVQTLRSKGFNVIVPASIPDTFIDSEKQVTEALQESQAPLLSYRFWKDRALYRSGLKGPRSGRVNL
jgi:hypothetical protein